MGKVFEKTFGEGVAAGMTGRKQTVTIEVDDQGLLDELGIAQWIVRVQAKQRAGKLEFLDGKTVKLSLITVKTSAPMTKEGAVKVFETESIENKIEMLYDLGMSEDAIRVTLDNLLAKGKISQEDFDYGIELIEISND